MNNQTQNQQNNPLRQENKRKSFNTKELAFIGLMGALMFALSFLFGSALNIATGNPAASGFITQIIQGIILTVAVLTTRKFGTATYMWLIYGILAIPTNMWGGLPGMYKVLISLATGLIFDTVIYLFRYKIRGLFAGSITTYIVLVPVLLWFYTQLNIPGAEKVLKYWPIMIVIFFALFSFGIWVGLKIFNRIKNKRTIKLITDK